MILSLTLSLSSCDCHYHLSGTVLEKNTKEPISNVAIGKTDTTDLDNPFNRKTYTDYKGQFEISGVSGRCNEITMYFSASDYRTEKRTFDNGALDTIYLERIKTNSSYQNNQPIYEKDTTIIVEWLGLSCYCPNWIEISHLKELKNDTLGIIKDKFSIAISASNGSKNLYKDDKFGIQTPLVYKLKGRFFVEEITHKEKGLTYNSRTFEYDSYEMIEY